jgi:microcin C transport system substrate-binding protein
MRHGGWFAKFSSRDWDYSAHAQRELWRHGLSLFGELKSVRLQTIRLWKSQRDQRREVRQAALGTSDNFNIVVAGVKDELAEDIGPIYDRLFVPALDEPSSTYALLAGSASYNDGIVEASLICSSAKTQPL